MCPHLGNDCNCYDTARGGEAAYTYAKQVAIVDIKVSRTKNNGVLYCSLIELGSSERMISADLPYIMQAIKERGYELVDAQDLLYKIGTNFAFFNKS